LGWGYTSFAAGYINAVGHTITSLNGHLRADGWDVGGWNQGAENSAANKFYTQGITDAIVMGVDRAGQAFGSQNWGQGFLNIVDREGQSPNIVSRGPTTENARQFQTLQARWNNQQGVEGAKREFENADKAIGQLPFALQLSAKGAAREAESVARPTAPGVFGDLGRANYDMLQAGQTVSSVVMAPTHVLKVAAFSLPALPTVGIELWRSRSEGFSSKAGTKIVDNFYVATVPSVAKKASEQFQLGNKQLESGNYTGALKSFESARDTTQWMPGSSLKNSAEKAVAAVTPLVTTPKVNSAVPSGDVGSGVGGASPADNIGPEKGFEVVVPSVAPKVPEVARVEVPEVPKVPEVARVEVPEVPKVPEVARVEVPEVPKVP
ncbi:MAG: hypothetical protein NTZ63_07010, partial [Candidatus Omnitrophica bacterium]|nr:hypothetical protein [Candidatus Omnitrophota bacterium]